MENTDFKVGDSFDIYRIENNCGYLKNVFTPGTFRPGDNLKHPLLVSLLSNIQGLCYYFKPGFFNKSCCNANNKT